MEQVKYHYPVPTSSNSTKLYHDNLWISQVMHAQCIKTETEHYRRIRNECSTTTSGCTMGTLYWQANDIWQGASWASLEYGGNWKMMHYFTRKMYSPVLVSLYNIECNVGVYIINDLPSSINGNIQFTMWSYGSLTALGSWSSPFSQSAASSSQQLSTNTTTLLQQGKCPSVNQCVLTYRAVASDGTTLSDNYYYISSPKDVVNTIDPKLTITSVKEVSSNPEYAHTFQVNFTSQAIASFVWLESNTSGHFSDNGFLWTPNAASSLLFFTRDSTASSASFGSTLAISSLWSVTH